jgi:hypothetical protein
MTDHTEDWRGDFRTVELEQLRAALAATPSQRLEWLEEAVKFAYAAGALPRREPESER